MRYLKNILMLMAGCLSLVSCEDKLTETPNSYYTEEEFFSDPDNVEMGILGIYNVLPSLYGDYGMAFFASDDTWYAAPGVSDSGRRDISGYTLTTSNKYVENAWLYTYQGLERANYMIARIEGMDEYGGNANLHKLVAEAKFLRALFSFNLVLYWGDVPYKTTSTDTYGEAYLPRTSREEIYDQIIEDLTDAEEGMDWATASSSPERATQGAARALKMRVLLQRAGYSLQMDGQLKCPEDNLRQEYFTAVIEEWEAFEANGYHRLYTTADGVSSGFDDEGRTIGNYEALFRTFSYGTLNSKESLFEVAFYTVDGSTGARGYWGTYNGSYVDAPSIQTTETSNYMGRANANFRVVPEWKGYFEADDERRDVMVCTYRYVWNSDIYNHEKQEQTATRSWYPGKWRREWMPLGYKDPNITDVNYCMLRYADVILMAAEAYNEIGETSMAWTLLNEVRDRANATAVYSLQDYRTYQSLPDLPFFNGGTAQDNFRTALYWERGFELAFEGMRRYDLLRWGILRDALVMTGNNTVANTEGSTRAYLAGDNFQTGKHELFPIPLDEIQANPLLENTNNPNY